MEKRQNRDNSRCRKIARGSEGDEDRCIGRGHRDRLKQGRGQD